MKDFEDSKSSEDRVAEASTAGDEPRRQNARWLCSSICEKPR
jgi:hypothetical protein